jgi:lipid II:glycine glycyltransferase (peptidoglycan interpeptide bridge formation enzyme)
MLGLRLEKGEMTSLENEMNGWNSETASLPGAHILQTWEWGQFKAMYGWRPIPKTWRDENGKLVAAAMVLARTIRAGGVGPSSTVLYVPRGPLLNWSDAELRMRVIDDLQQLAKKERAIFIKIDPEVMLGKGIPGAPGEQQVQEGLAVQADLKQRGWRFSAEQIQFRNTAWLDLSGSEADWLARMKQKTRYNLRLAEKRGVVIRRGAADDLPLMYQMYAETSVRDGFVIRSEGYYRRVWESFMKTGMAEVLLAEVDGEPVAGLIIFFFAGRAWYLYGMSRQAHREKMPNYLLQWEAMRAARDHGCKIYDLWGAPDQFNPDDPLWGVFRFKEGLGAEVIRFIGAWDFPARPFLYQLYTGVLPRILAVMRSRGKARVRREVSP